MPTEGAGGERAVGPENGRLEIRHPVSAEPLTLDGLAIDEQAVLGVIDDIVRDLESPCANDTLRYGGCCPKSWSSAWARPSSASRRMRAFPTIPCFTVPISPAVSGPVAPIRMAAPN